MTSANVSSAPASGTNINRGSWQPPQALYWELASQEELDPQDQALSSPDDGSGVVCQVIDVAGDILVFEGVGNRSLLRRYNRYDQEWQVQTISVVVHAAVLSPIDARVVCILHCPSEWNSDHRYEVYAFDADTNKIDPLWVSSSKSEQLIDAGIAPKKRHGFSIAPHGRCIYLLCGLQHFPGDTTGSFVYCFSLDECVWTEVEYSGVFPAPYPESPYAGCRFGQSCVVYDGKAWLFGGCVEGAEGAGVESTNGLYTFDLQDHAWDAISAHGRLHPPPMSGHAALVCHGRMLVFGGEGASQDIFSYNISTQTWELLPPIMLGPRP